MIEGIKTFWTALNRAIESNLQISNLEEYKSIGFLWNKYCNELNTENQAINDLTLSYCLWSTNSTIGTDTWIYNIDSKIFIEVSQTYRWHFDDPVGLNHITYDQFIAEYKPIDVLEIDNSTAKEWLKICEEILNNL